jgi:hypothetical protein
VNAEAKRITSSLEAIEEPLKSKKQAVDDKVEQERAELAAKHQAWIDGRISESVKVTGKPISTAEAESWTDEQFAEYIEAGRKAKAEADAKAKAEAATLAQEEADRKAKIKDEQDQIAADKAALARQKTEQDEREREIEAKLAKILRAEEMAARIQPATVIGENDLAGKLLRSHEDRSGAEQVLKAQVEAMANFPEFPCPGFPEAEAAEDLKGESRDALVGAFDSVDPVCAVNRMAVPIESAQEIMDAAEHEAARNLIAPNHGEIMLLLRTMQVGAKRLEEFFDDAEGVLWERYVMAEDIRIAVDDLLEEMDNYAPK